jgi:hypothetical protein
MHPLKVYKEGVLGVLVYFTHEFDFQIVLNGIHFGIVKAAIFFKVLAIRTGDHLDRFFVQLEFAGKFFRWEFRGVDYSMVLTFDAGLSCTLMAIRKDWSRDKERNMSCAVPRS